MDTQPETPHEEEIPGEIDNDLRYVPLPSSDTDTMMLADSEFNSSADDLDIDAALAAVATLDDMLAEQEAAEQARIAREEADAQAREQRQARLKNPELFFPMPSMYPLQRGRIDSVIPALTFIGIGAWLTLTITSGAAPSQAAIWLVILAGLGIILLAHWLVSGRWAGGNLFFALVLLLVGGTILLLSAGPGLGVGFPLLLTALGAALLLTGLLSQPAQRRLIFPGIAFAFAGLAGFIALSGLLPFDLIGLAAVLWPVVLVILLIIFVLPLIFRRRQQR